MALSLAGEAAVLNWDYLPIAAAKEAEVVDNAFRTLVIMAVPVMAFVVAALAYSVLRFRVRGENPEVSAEVSAEGSAEDGPPIHSSRPVLAIWFLVTTALTVLLIIHPGITGLRELRDASSPATGGESEELMDQVQGMRWIWKMTYPKEGVTTFNELVLSVDRPVRFEVSAVDVLHSFWVPAFRMKIDAVPGITTTLRVTPNRLGDMGDDSGFRLQCAEMCGLGHTLTQVPVRVVEPAEFQAWVSQQTAKSQMMR